MTAIASTSLLRSLTVVVTQVGIDGKPKAETLIRPLRTFTDGSGFAVKLSGKVIPVTPTGTNGVTVLLADARRPEADTRVACLADLGIAKGSKPAPQASAVPAQAAAKAGPKREITPAQAQVLADGRAKLAAKRSTPAPIAKATSQTAEPTPKATLNTIGDLLVAKHSKADICEFVAGLLKRI